MENKCQRSIITMSMYKSKLILLKFNLKKLRKTKQKRDIQTKCYKMLHATVGQRVLVDLSR